MDLINKVNNELYNEKSTIVVCKYNFKFFMLMKKLFGLPCLH